MVCFSLCLSRLGRKGHMADGDLDERVHARPGDEDMGG